VRAFLLLLAPIVGSVAFQMTVDAGYIRGFAWAVPWVWALCASLWAGWLLSHDKLKIKLQGFHARVGKGIHPIRIGLCVAIFLLVGFALRAILPKSESVVATDTGALLSATVAKDTPAVPLAPSMAEVAKPVNPIIKHKAIPALSGPNQGMDLGTDNTIVGKIPTGSKLGSGNTIVGATDSNGNTIINRGGTAIGNGATADPGSIAIGAHAHAGGDGTRPMNSLIENSGKLYGSRISNSEVTAPPGGAATVLRNLPGAEADVTIENSHVSNALPASGLTSSSDRPRGEYVLTNTDNNELYANTVCGSPVAIQTKGKDNGNEFRDISLNDPRRCNWIKFLMTALQHIGDITTFMDNWETVMEQSWSNLPTEKRDSNHAELAAIKKRIINSAGTRSDFVSLIVTVGPTPPSFDVKQP
jgi:hypothetical protein